MQRNKLWQDLGSHRGREVVIEPAYKLVLLFFTGQVLRCQAQAKTVDMRQAGTWDPGPFSAVLALGQTSP